MNFQFLFLLGMVLVIGAASSSLTACERRGIPAPTLSSSATASSVSQSDRPADMVQPAYKAAVPAATSPAPVTVYVKPPYGASAPMATGSEGVNKPVVHGGVDQPPITVPPAGGTPSTQAATTSAGGLAAPEAMLNGTPPAAGQSSGGASALSAAEERFILGALDAALAELRLSQLAAERANNSIVKSYAALLITDQTALVTGLQRLAQQKGVPTLASLSEARQRVVDSVARAGQESFDQSYLKVAGSAENQALVTLFERADRDARDPVLKSLVQSALPTLRAHLSASEQLPVKG